MNRCHFCTSNTTNPKFCNSSCAAFFNNDRRKVRSSTSRDKTRNALKAYRSTEAFREQHPLYTRIALITCPQCSITKYISHPSGKRVNKYCSKLCQLAAASERTSAWLKQTENRNNLGRGKKSYLESSFEAWLASINITDFTTETKFYNESLKKTYFVDFLFPQKRLIIELDGTQHRNTVDSDKIRDAFLYNQGYEVIRITHKQYREKIWVPYLLVKLATPGGIEPHDFRPAV